MWVSQEVYHRHKLLIVCTTWLISVLELNLFNLNHNLLSKLEIDIISVNVLPLLWPTKLYPASRARIRSDKVFFP
jgi:hypothetical protein